jgi:hypothetical protein
MVVRSGLAVVLALAACGGDKDATTDGGPTPPTETGTLPTGETGDTGTEVISELVVGDDNVYSVTADYSIATGTLRAAWDPLVSWPDLTVDAWGDPLDPVAVPVLALLEIVETPDRIGERLAADDLGADLVAEWRADVSGTSFANLSELTAVTGPFDPVSYLVEDAAKTWLLVLAEEDGTRLVPRTFFALAVDDGGDTSPEFVDRDTTVNWTALLDGSPVAASAGVASVTVDWDGLAMDALGKAYDERLGDELFVGRYAQPASALGTSMLTLEQEAEVWYTMDVVQDTDARLELARDAAGGTFPGFDSAGTWLVGVRCNTCLTRLPLWVAVVEVR